VLLDIFRAADPPPYLRDEAILAMASILDIQNQFYPLLVRYLEDDSLAVTLALDEAEAAYESYMAGTKGLRSRKNANAQFNTKQAKGLQEAVAAYMKNINGALLTRWIMDFPEGIVPGIAQTVLAEAVLDDELSSHDRLRLLISHWAAHELRVITKVDKV
jgi:hypothetical protein